MNPLWSPFVNDLAPYTPGEQPRDQRYIKLNTNENPYPPSPLVAEVLRSFETGALRRYPDPQSLELTEALAACHGLESDQVFIGNGSDEVLAHAFQAFFCQSAPLLFPDISYSFYPVYCSLYRIDYQTVPLDERFRVNVRDYATRNGGIIIPNPNAPTGIALELAAIRELLADNPESAVIVDEAYVDFGADSAVALIDEFPNQQAERLHRLLFRIFSRVARCDTSKKPLRWPSAGRPTRRARQRLPRQCPNGDGRCGQPSENRKNHHRSHRNKCWLPQCPIHRCPASWLGAGFAGLPLPNPRTV